MADARNPEPGGEAAGGPFVDLARLACALPGVSGIVIVRRSADGWRELVRSGAGCDGSAVSRAMAGPWDRPISVNGSSPIVVEVANGSGGKAGALIVTGNEPDRAALALVASQAGALMDFRDAAEAQAAASRRARFASRLSGRLRAAQTPERVVATTIDEVRSELGAESVSFGLLSDGGSVAVETSRLGGEPGSVRRMPLAAFGIEDSLRGLDRPVTFPTAASATVPVSSDGRLLAILHLQAGESRTWSVHELGLAAEAAEILWRERARAQCETELRAGEGRLNAVLESVSDGFYALDAAWRFTVFNRAAERFFGMPSDRVRGRPLHEVFPEVIRSPLEGHLAHVMASGVPGAIEMRSAARPERTVELRASPQAGGGVAVTFTDVTDRLARLDQLNGIEARLTALLGQARAGICETTLDGRFLSVNPRFCEIVGRTETELLQLDQGSITVTADVPESLELCRRMADTGEGFTIEKRYDRPGRSAVRVTNAVGLLNGREGTTALAIIIARS